MQKIKSYILAIGISSIAFSCKKQLDVKNPNSPTPSSAATEVGIIDLAQGGVYLNGFHNTKYSGDQLYGGFWGETANYHSLMGDETWQEGANEFMNQLGAPYTVTFDNGTVVNNPNAPQSEIDLIRQINKNGNGYSNPLYYEWAYMYNLNYACNNMLSIASNVTFSGNATAKLNTIQAWAYFWKGYAYSRIGSLYYSAIVNNAINITTNGNYLVHQQIIDTANACFDQAAALINGISDATTYSTIMGELIPGIFQVGLGLPPTQAMWIRNINTYKARNILVNNTVASMTASQWDSVYNFASAGIQQGDYVFTARSDNNSTFMGAKGSLAGESIGDPNNTAGWQIMERLIQDFKPGDYRFNNNFSLSSTGTFTYPDRSEAGGTRWQLLDGNPISTNTFPIRALTPDSAAKYAKTVILANSAVGQYELYLAGTYEENELMKAEANIYKGNIDQGLASIDNVRSYQGAGLAAVSGTNLTLAQAKEELRKERRIALMFRGLAFYDARRWGVITDVSKGGGRTGCWAVDATGKLSTNATINYNYMDYWDVPDNEVAYNAAVGGTPIFNPEYPQ